MKKYKFDQLESSIPAFQERDHIIPAQSLADALRKFCRKHELEAPAYWDEPSYDTYIELIFKNRLGSVKYRVSW